MNAKTSDDVLQERLPSQTVFLLRFENLMFAK